MANLITKTDIENECRPTTAQDALVDRCIEEAQNLDVIPQVSADIWLQIPSRETLPDIKTLWIGGQYVDSCGETHIFAGLKKTLCYYAYARLVRSSGGVSTRFDFVVKADQYSDSADIKAKTQAYNEAFATADGYMAQCLAYINNTLSLCKKRKLINNRISIKKIGY